jgi:RecB family exonuclease
VLAALAGAPEGGRVLSFPRGDLRRGGERVPSRWLLPTLRALTGDPGRQATTWTRTPSPNVVELPSHAAALQRCDMLASEQEWRLRAAAAGVDTGDLVLARARETRRARASAEFTRFDGNLTHVDTLPDPTTGRPISPTALQSYVECPHGYFLRHLLGVNPVETPEELVSISPLDIGVRVHRMLERFIDAALERWPLAPAEPWPADAHARLLEIAEEECACAEADGITGFPLLWERDKATILADLAGVPTAEDARRARHGVVPWRTELPFGTGGTDPVRLGLGDGRALMLRGMADRVDRSPSGGRIVVIDYKAGSIMPYRHLDATDPTHTGRRLQLPVYALAARAAVGDPAAPVRAEYWFPNRRSNYEDIGYEVTDDILDETRRVLRVIVDGISGGLFPARPVKNAGAYSCDWCDIAGHPSVGSRWEKKKAAEPLASYLALITGTSV